MVTQDRREAPRSRCDKHRCRGGGQRVVYHRQTCSSRRTIQVRRSNSSARRPFGTMRVAYCPTPPEGSSGEAVIFREGC
jgi:hypothetical protein